MMSPKVTSPEEEGGPVVDGAEREGGVAKFDCRDQNWASLSLMIA